MLSLHHLQREMPGFQRLPCCYRLAHDLWRPHSRKGRLSQTIWKLPSVYMPILAPDVIVYTRLLTMQQMQQFLFLSCLVGLAEFVWSDSAGDGCCQAPVTLGDGFLGGRPNFLSHMLQLVQGAVAGLRATLIRPITMMMRLS